EGRGRREATRESGGGNTVWKGCRQLLKVGEGGPGGIVPIRAVEYIIQFHPHIEGHSLSNPEGPADVHIFRRTALLPVITIVSRRVAELTALRIDPRIRIQNERWFRDVAMAIEIDGEQRLARHPIGKTGTVE